jgi:hypothetical protein
VRLRYDLDAHLRFHSEKHSLIPATAPGTVRRRDTELVHLFTITKEFVYKSQNLAVSLEYLLDENMSNLDPFDYDRHVMTTSLTWRF